MGRHKQPTDIDSAIERLRGKAIAAAAKADPSRKASKALLEIAHHATALQFIKVLTSDEPVAGQTLGAVQRFLQGNAIKREPGFDDDSADGTDNYAAHLDKLSAGLDLPYGDDGSDIEDYNILEDNSK
jgi:hypothetical protein